jgi:integrase
VTVLRYWRSVQSFFAWATAEGYLSQDPSSGLRIEARKGEKRRSPPPFSEEEVRRFCITPLYAGYKSVKRVMEWGECRRRTGKWWAGILMMYTGLRAGELSQLLPADFDFHGPIPSIRIQEEDESGRRVKTAKTEASVRDVPVHPALMTLGLREFVSERARRDSSARVFRDFRLGARGKVSDGMSKFWSRYLRAFGLWKEGRSTHVWRHTVVAVLRARGAAEEDIAAVIGHSGGTVTSRYGGGYPLSRKLQTLRLLDYGFDVVESLGGPYDTACH